MTQNVPPAFRIRPGDRFLATADADTAHIAAAEPVRFRQEADAVCVAACGETIRGPLYKPAYGQAAGQLDPACVAANVFACPSCGAQPGCNIDCAECAIVGAAEEGGEA